MPSRLVTVDALRGVACLWVAFYHVGVFAQKTLWTGWAPLLADDEPRLAWATALVSRLGFQGVSLFLVLSGFCLYLPVLRRSAAGAETVPLPAFVRARALRILPAYYASLAALWVATATWAPARWAIFRPIEAWDVGVHALLVHNLVPKSMLSINGVYWSLALEVQLYLVFPLLVVAGRRVGIGLVALGAIALSLAWPAMMGRAYPDLALDTWPVVFESLPSRLGEFVAGMLAASLVARGARPWVPRVAWVLALLWFPASYAVHVARSVELPIDKPACAVSFAAIVFLVVRSEPSKPGLFLRAFGHVGTVSFSLYLIQQPLILAMRPYLWAHDFSRERLWVLSIVVGLPALTAFAALFYRLFEAPFLPGGALRERLLRPRR